MKRRSWIKIGAFATAAVTAGVVWYIRNAPVEVESIHVSLKSLPKAFEGFRIAHISDTHYPHCALSPEQIAAFVRKQKPDMIVLTGDLSDRFSDFDAQAIERLGKALAVVAPTYAVSGNHEVVAGKYREWALLLEKGGVTVLDDTWISLKREEEAIALGGSLSAYAALSPDLPGVSLLLSHFPENMELYKDAGISLTFCGHAHGGQVRIFGQGILSPGEGFFPRYTSGLYSRGNTQMVVSRGLKTIWMPPRVGNPPHIPLVVLHGEE